MNDRIYSFSRLREDFVNTYIGRRKPVEENDGTNDRLREELPLEGLAGVPTNSD